MISFSVLFLLVFSLRGADNYEIGDQLFVCAKDGLNLREGPSTKFQIISKLNFGEELYIQEKTIKPFNITGVSKTNSIRTGKEVAPLIFKGFWVKIITKEGKVGYIIDQYILPVQPELNSRLIDFSINLSTIGYDVIYESPIFEDGSRLKVIKEYRFGNNIKLIETSTKSWTESKYIFPNMSLEEVMILLSSSWNDFKYFTIDKNWKEKVNLFDEGICEFEVKVIENTVEVKIECSC